MTEYLHHVPGRLRIRSRVFRSQTPSRGQALRKLRAMDGVTGVRLNSKAGSVTVSYDKDVTKSTDIMELLERCACMRSTAKKAASQISAPSRRASTKTESKRDGGFDLTREVGKIAFNVLVSRGVTYSLGALLGAKA